MDIIYSELYFGLILVVTIFFFQFLSNNYKHNKNSYTIIIMNKMIVVNTCISQERLPIGRRCRATPSRFDTWIRFIDHSKTFLSTLSPCIVVHNVS